MKNSRQSANLRIFQIESQKSESFFFLEHFEKCLANFELSTQYLNGVNSEIPIDHTFDRQIAVNQTEIRASFCEQVSVFDLHRE